ncbi:MAG: glycoside hydrolase domain-containing protein [Candidatus Sigynarchaeum springense]
MHSIKLALTGIVISTLVADLWVVTTNPVFSSRWTWAYNDLRELHYLAPYLNVITYMAAVCLFFLACYELLIASRDPSGTITSASKAGKSVGIVLLGFAGFGVCQELMASQPLWVSLCTIAWLAIMECVFILITNLQSWRRSRRHDEGIKDDNDVYQDAEPRFTLKERMRIKPFKIYIFIGLALWCVFVALYPAQLVFQEGPTNAWGTSVLVAATISGLLLISWWYYRLSALASLLTITLVASFSPLLLVMNSAAIPGSVPAAQYFSLVGLVSTLAWIVYQGYQNRAKWSPRHTLLALWLWGLGLVVFFHDPLLEIWEMEEGLLDLQTEAGTLTDPYGTGIGLYYPLVLIMALVGVACAAALFSLDLLIKKARKRRPASLQQARHPVPVSPTTAPPTRALISPLTATDRKKQFYASLVIFAVALSCTMVLTRENITTNAPVIVADMGEHGVLWLANSYDRVLPDYHPDFSVSPRNSTIDVRAMRGEAELVQLVFSPLASKMISFNGYHWNCSGAPVGDNQWRMENGTIARIPITTGRVGYLNCFNPRIADVLLPWKSFITGSETRENIPFWLEIKVPRNVSAGIYSTQFEYLTTSYLQRVPRTASLKFTIRLTVWNYTKPLNRTMDTCIGLHPENPQNKDKLLKLATRYGADPYGYWFKDGDIVYDASNLSKGITINWTTFDAQVQDMLDAGMNQIKIDFYPGIDCRNDAGAVLDGSKDNYLKLIRWFYGNATLHLASKTTPWGTTWASEAITQHSDEPDPRIDPLAPKAFDLVYQIVHNASNGTIRSFQTFAYEPAFDEWLDSLDIWVLTPDSFSPEVSAKIHGAGHEVWTYSNGDNFPGTDTDLRTPLIMSRLRGWIGYRYNISGFLHWVFFWNYNDAGRSGCGYDGRGDGTLIVPHESGYVPTLRLAAFRDGLEDNELLWALNKTITRAQALGKTDPALAEAISAMRSVDAALGKQPVDAQWPLPVVTREFDHSARTYMELRARCGTLLDRLLSLM